MRKYLTTWFIIATTIFITSCGGFRSIRNSKIISSPSQANQSISEKNDEELIEYGTQKNMSSSLDINPKNQDDEDYSKLANIVSNRIPTLREQMQTLAQTQDLMKNDLSAVKSDLEEMKVLISDLKSSIDKYIPAGTRLPATGPDNRITSENTLKSNNSSNILFSDEKTLNSNSSISNKAMSETYLQSDEKISSKTKVKSKPKTHIANQAKQEKLEIDNDSNDNDNSQFITGKEYLVKKQYANAIESFKNALSTETSRKKEAEIEYYLGESYYFLGEYDKSIEYMNKVLSAKESSFQDGARLRKAEANLKSGKVADAKAEYQALIRNHPSSNYVPQARKMLQQL